MGVGRDPRFAAGCREVYNEPSAGRRLFLDSDTRLPEPWEAFRNRGVMKRLKLQAGSNIVEFALVLPLLLVLVFGIIDFSLALFDKAVITNASREGARAGMVFKVPRMTNAEIEAVVQAYASNYLITFGTPNLQTSVSRIDVDGVGGNTSSGDTLSVTVSYPYNYLVMNKLIPALGSLNLSSTAVMRYE